MNSREAKKVIIDKLLEFAAGLESNTVVIDEIQNESCIQTLNHKFTVKAFGGGNKYVFLFTLKPSDIEKLT